MLRHGVVAFLGCLYVALSVWIVGKQGETFREGLRSDRLVADGAEKPSLPPAEPQPLGQATASPATDNIPARADRAEFDSTGRSPG